MQNGKIAIADGLANSIGFGSTEFHVLRPGPKIIGRWLYILMRHKDFRKDAETHFKGTQGNSVCHRAFYIKKLFQSRPFPNSSVSSPTSRSFRQRWTHSGASRQKPAPNWMRCCRLCWIGHLRGSCESITSILI